jgi:hypothetical protein
VSVFALCAALDGERRFVARTVRLAARLVPVGLGYLAVMYLSGRIWGTLGARNETANDLGGKLDWFLDEVLPRVLAPFQLSPGRFLAGLATGLLILAAAAVPGRRVHELLGRATLVAICLVATYAPNLVVAESWASARSLFVTLATSAALAGVGVRNLLNLGELRRARPIWLVAATATSALLVVNAMSNTIGYVAEPNAVELRAVEVAAIEAAEGSPPAIVFVAASFNSTLAPGISMDEFGYPAAAVAYAIPGMVEAALDDVGFPGDVLVVAPGFDPSEVPDDAAVVVLDDVLRAVDSP